MFRINKWEEYNPWRGLPPPMAFMQVPEKVKDYDLTHGMAKELFESIKKSGIVNSLIVLQSGRIVDGYVRLCCANRLSVTEVPVLIPDHPLYNDYNAFLSGMQNHYCKDIANPYAKCWKG